jgi:hypothetical protein
LRHLPDDADRLLTGLEAWPGIAQIILAGRPSRLSAVADWPERACSSKPLRS